MQQFTPEGILTLTWYMYMCLPFGLFFCKFWYGDWGEGVSLQMKAPN